MDKTTKIIVWVVVLVVVLWLGYTYINKPKTVSGEPIRIGAILILSGTGASWGENSKMGADLALEEINNAGGVNGQPIEVVYQDNPGDNPTSAVNALQNLINQDIKIVLGTNWTPSGLATAQLACEKGVIMISPTLGVAEFNETCDYLFNLWPHDDKLSEKLGRWLYEKGYRKVAVLGSIQEWEQAQANAVKRGFESVGGKLAIFEITAKDEKDFRTAAAKIKTASPDAIVFTNFAYEHLAAKRVKELGVTVPFFSVLIDDERIQGAAGAFENAVVITSFTLSDEFSNKFVKKYNKQPDIGSDTSYDVINLITQAIQKNQSTDPTVLKEYLNSLTFYSGASGDLKFDDKGGVTKEPLFKVVKEGKLTDLE